MKKEWLIIGATGAVCAAVWGVLLMTVFEPSGSDQTETALSEEEQELVDFYAQQPDDEPAAAAEPDPADEPPAAVEEESEDLEKTELEDVPEQLIEKIKDQGLEVEDIREAAPDQRMSIDDLLAFLEELEAIDE
ncbi:hypothetical protein ACFO4L_13260 [Bacillus daqingensis]|uniref:Uncharacterized protein n=1 Tax=Bacillus daqingensis TaxID=872396 RepID=A0ABV9NZU0_9BACI